MPSGNWLFLQKVLHSRLDFSFKLLVYFLAFSKGFQFSMLIYFLVFPKYW